MNEEMVVSEVFNVETENLLLNEKTVPKPFTFTINIGPLFLNPRVIPGAGRWIGFATKELAEEERARLLSIIQTTKFHFVVIQDKKVFASYLEALEYIQSRPMFEPGWAFSEQGRYYVVHDQSIIDKPDLLTPMWADCRYSIKIFDEREFEEWLRESALQ